MEDYAVIKTGGKQYLVEKGTLLSIEKIDGKPGEKVTFDDVLLTSLSGKVNIGKPIVQNSSVTGEIKSQFKGPKVKGIRYKNKTRSKGPKKGKSLAQLSPNLFFFLKFESNSIRYF